MTRLTGDHRFAVHARRNGVTRVVGDFTYLATYRPNPYGCRLGVGSGSTFNHTPLSPQETAVVPRRLHGSLLSFVKATVDHRFTQHSWVKRCKYLSKERKKLEPDFSGDVQRFVESAQKYVEQILLYEESQAYRTWKEFLVNFRKQNPRCPACGNDLLHWGWSFHHPSCPVWYDAQDHKRAMRLLSRWEPL